MSGAVSRNQGADWPGMVAILVDTFKGGVGKTTTALGLSRALSAFGPTVLVGTSPQNDILDVLDVVPVVNWGVRDFLESGHLPDQYPISDTLRFVPAGYADPQDHEQELGVRFRALWAQLDAQFVVVDGFNCTDETALGALYACDVLVTPSTIYPESTRAVLRIYQHVTDAMPPEERPTIARVLLTQVPSASRRNKKEEELYQAVTRRWKPVLFQTQIRRSARYTLTELPDEYNMSIRGSLQMSGGPLAQDYHALAVELLELMREYEIFPEAGSVGAADTSVTAWEREPTGEVVA